MLSDNSILIIESQVTTHDIAAVLKQADYFVLTTSDFENAAQIIRECKPVLLICNEAVENSKSVKICLQLNAEPELNLPVICLIGSEKSQSNQIQLSLETGANKYLELPIEPLKFIKEITSLIEGHRAKASLEQKDVIFRSLIESITDIITVISPDGFILYESPSVERTLGRKPVDSLGVNAFNFIYPADRQKVVDYIFKANYEEAAKGVEYRIKHNDGSWRIFHSVGRFNKSIFKTKTVLITSRDVTARKLLAERHQIALEKARMIWWEWDAVKDKIITSDNFAEIYGPAAITKSAERLNVVHPYDVKHYRKLVEGIAKSGGSYHVEYRIIRQNNGKTVWLEETASALLNDKKEVERLIGISFDVSERKNAESDLRESEEKFKALLKASRFRFISGKKRTPKTILCCSNQTMRAINRRHLFPAVISE